MSKTQGDVITCNDCGLVGYRLINGLDFILPSGWLQVYSGLKCLHICPSCISKRRRFVNDMVINCEVDN